jgi:hypothetical protein
VFERRHGVGAVGDGDDVAANGGVQLGEAVVAGGVALAEHPEGGAALVDDDDGTVGALVDEGEGVADRVVRRQRDGRLVQRVAALDVVDDRGDDVERDVLGQHRQPAATGHRLGHPPARHRRHVGDDDRQCRPDAVGRGEVDVVARSDRRQARDHEDVVVGQVVTGIGMEHPHDRSRLRRHRPSTIWASSVRIPRTGTPGSRGTIRCAGARR